MSAPKMNEAEREALLVAAYAYAFPANNDDPRPEWNALVVAVEGILAREAGVARAFAERELNDLRSRLACAVEATYWDRPYDVRLEAIRGMGDLSTNGMAFREARP